MPMHKYIQIFIILFIAALMMNNVSALPLSPVEEPKADSFYICYESRCPNDVHEGLLVKYIRYKYLGCLISKVPCHLYCGDKFTPGPAKPMLQFQWVNNYPDALNSFYRCAYN
jgi:hypothetical protein